MSVRRGPVIVLMGLVSTMAVLFASNTAPAVGESPIAPTPVMSSTDCGNGWSAQTITRPTSIDALTATAAQLDADDLPPRPSDPAALAIWQNYVTHPIRSLATCDGMHPVTDGQDGGASEVNTNSSSPVSNSADTSTNWAGNVAQSQTWEEVEAEWYVPSASGPTGADSSQWVGVGLGNSSSYPLYQMGDEAPSNQDYSVWLEVFPQYPEEAFGEVAPGNLIEDLVSVRSTGTTFSYSNLSTGAEYNYTWSHSSVSDGHAEWIDERPTNASGYLDQYAKNTVQFLIARAWSPATGWVLVGNTSHYYYNMYGCNGTELASTAAITDSEDYYVNWHAYGISEKPDC